MEPNTIVNILLSLVVLALFIITLVKLYLRKRETKLSNLMWLVGFFVCSSLIGIFKAAGSSATGISFNILEILFYIFEFTSLFFLIFFTKETFYKNQRSSFKILLIVSIIFAISCFTFVLLRLTSESVTTYDNFYLLDAGFLGLVIIIVTFWNASASFKVFNLIRDEKIDRNIKLRYRIIAISSIIYGLQGFLTPIHVAIRVYAPLEVYDFTSNIYTFMNVFTQLIFASGNYFAWIILGSKIESPVETVPEIDEEVTTESAEPTEPKIEQINFIKFFGETLSRKIGKDELTSRGLILYAIKDEYGSYDTVNFEILKNTFEKTLKERLEKVNVSNIDNICNEMIKELIKNQSLLTMGAV
ncbi:MAG: hypothetical protein ACXAAH_08625 [Promethearchaeota archaeon]|jgi:hypothetical protein